MNAPIHIKNLLPTTHVQQGTEIVHESAHLHVTGSATYTDDIPELAGTLYAAIIQSPVAHGELIGEGIDREAILREHGVVAVYTAKDIPGENNCGPIVHDDPFLADGKVGVGTAQAYELLPTKGAVDVVRARCNSSLLTKTFNALWCAALNARAAGVTHFAMIHADIHPSAHGWLDVMVGELVKHDADMIAAVSPLKNDFGLTSTAVAVDSCDPWLCRRLTMREVYELPETFGAADVGGPLLLNTGLFVCDLSRPWWDELEPDGRTLKLCFDFKNRIIRDPETGEFHAEAVSEDWLFSQELNRRGAKLMATRKVVLGHEGSKEYTTDRAWGTQLTDELFHKLNAKRCANANSVSAGLPD